MVRFRYPMPVRPAVAVLAAWIILLAAFPQPVDAQETEQAILRELREIRRLLEENLQRGRTAVPQAPSRVEKLEGVSVGIYGNRFKGSGSARVTIVEFSDFQCPFCARHVKETLPLLEQEFIGTGLVKYVFRNFPLDELHPTARAIAIGAECAGDQQKYWDMHDFLFANQTDLGAERIESHAELLGLEMDSFHSCVTGEAVQHGIQRDVEDARSLGLNGTPSFFFGVTRDDGNDFEARYLFRGALPYSEFKTVIERLLKES